jgi:protein ImuB
MSGTGGRRVVALALSSLRLTLARQANELAAGTALAVVVTRQGSVVKDERSLLGNTRLDEVDERAAHEGIRPGHTIAQARARLAELAVRVVAEEAAQAALESLAEAMLAFGATTSILRDRDTILIDVTGCAHLHPPTAGEAIAGETELARRIAARSTELGFTGTLAIADGPERAWALARFVANAHRPIVIVAPGEERAATASLSVSALRLDDATTSFFVKLGIRTLGDLVQLPRSSLAARLGRDARRVFALLDGRDATPLVRHEPKPTIAERIDLEYGAETLEPVYFVLRSLAARVAARLDGRVASAGSLEVVLALDAAMLPPEDTDGRVRTIRIPLPLPLHRSEELFVVLRARLERIVALSAPVLSVTLGVPELVARTSKERSLFRADGRAASALAPLVAELGAILGEDALGKLVPVARWREGDRSELVRLDVTRAPASPRRFLTAAREPLRWLPNAEPCPDALPIAHLLRTESIEWWRPNAPPPVDRLVAHVHGALAVIEVDASSVRLCGFMD